MEFDSVSPRSSRHSRSVWASAGRADVALAGPQRALVVRRKTTRCSSAVPTSRRGSISSSGLRFAEGPLLCRRRQRPARHLPVGKSLGPLLIQSVNRRADSRAATTTRPISRSRPRRHGVQPGPGRHADRRPRRLERARWTSGTRQTLGFKAPTGIGVDIDAGTVSGGGFLFHDHGASTSTRASSSCRISDLFTAKAIGLLTTRAA